MIKNIFLFVTLLFFSTLVSAQDENPKIGSEKGVKEKLVRIKKGLPDIKKNLTTYDEDLGDYNVKFEMGNGLVLFKEDEEEHEQSLLIRYTPSYYSGTKTDYQNYYKTLVALIKDVFGPAYDTGTDNSESSWETYFKEKGKRHTESSIYITIRCVWVLDLLSITIDIHSKVK